MATIAPGLNFRIGADVKGINKAIREAERSLKGAVSTFSSIGNSLSLALSAPIAAFGALSIKAAGDMEAMRFALEGTMKDAGRSVNEARAELEELRKAALAPGLDFEQAVRGSVRLQSVGKSAEEARQIIVQLANALALSGGTADQLDGVTRQFTQMIGKGKIMQEDLTIILENMPALAKVMKDTFGTTNAEMLRKMGVNVDDFISKLTTGMQTLPRAQGGIANSIVNAQNAIKQAIADVGAELNKTFNISGKQNDFAEWVAGLAKWFRGLDEDTKRTIASFVVFAAVIGPAFKAMQLMVQVVGAARIAWLSMGKAMAVINSAQGLQGVVKWFGALNVVMKASVIGSIAAVVIAVAAAFSVLSEDMSQAAQTGRMVKDAMREVNSEAARESATLNANIEVLKNSNSTQDERRKAIKALQDQYPEYLGSIDLEKASLTDLNTIQNRVNQSILQSVAARKQSILIDEQYAKIADARLRLQEIEKKGFDALTGEEVKRAGRSLFGTEFEKGFVMASARVATVSDVVKALQSDIKNADDAVKQINTSFKEAFATGDSVVGTDDWSKYYGTVKAGTPAIEEQTGAVNDLADSYRELDKAAKLRTRKQETEEVKAFKADVSPQIEGPQMPDMVQSTEAFSGLPENIGIATSAMQEHITVAGQAAEIYKQIQDGIGGLSTSMQGMANGLLASGDIIGSVFLSMGSAFAEAGEKGAASMGELAAAAVAAAAKVIKTYIQMAVTRAALSALQGLPFPINLAAAAAAGGIASALFSNLIKAVGIPALAEGGVVKHPTAVMVGEYMGARANPEIIAPESKLRDVFSEVLRASGGMGGGKLVARVSGRDLLFVVEQAQVDAGRRRGK